jgi:hypothetical protein
MIEAGICPEALRKITMILRQGRRERVWCQAKTFFGLPAKLDRLKMFTLYGKS